MRRWAGPFCYVCYRWKITFPPKFKTPTVIYFFLFFSLWFLSFHSFFHFLLLYWRSPSWCVCIEDVPEQSCSHPHILQQSLKLVLVFRPHKYICYVQYTGAKLVHLLTPVSVSTVTEEPNGFHLFTSLYVFQKSNHSPWMSDCSQCQWRRTCWGNLWTWATGTAGRRSPRRTIPDLSGSLLTLLQMVFYIHRDHKD